jgi:hypothetical protein
VIWPGLVAVAMPKAYWVAAHRLSERIFKTCVLGGAEHAARRAQMRPADETLAQRLAALNQASIDTLHGSQGDQESA